MTNLEEYLDRHPKETKRLIGIDEIQFQDLLIMVQKLHEEKQGSRPRLIRAGGGRRRSLSVKQELLLTLVYLHQYPTFQFLGIQFGVSESTANDIFHYWVKILQELLPASLMEQIKKKEDEWSWIEEILSEQELIVDSSQQYRERPQNPQEQKKHYSGYKGGHTFKNQLIITEDGREIVDVVVGYPGPINDLKLWESQRDKFSASQKFQGDAGYIGEVTISAPHKKPKKGKLTSLQKEENRQKARRRIRVEHMIRLGKIFRVASERFRLSSRHYESIISLIFGLIRYRIGTLILT